MAVAQLIGNYFLLAVSHYRRALALRGDWLPPLIELAWLLATSADVATRDAAEAISLADRAVALSNRLDPVLDIHRMNGLGQNGRGRPRHARSLRRAGALRSFAR